MALVQWPLVCLVTAVLAVTSSHGVELKDELDSLLCPATTEMKGKIIDVHRSLDLGAKLLDGSWASSLEQCASECCHKLGCDLALYKNEGVSQSGKNCYYIKCVSMENCVMVEHGGFTSVVFKMEKDKDVPGNKPSHDGSETAAGDTDRTGHDPVPLANLPPPTTAPPKPVTDKGNSVQSTTTSQSDSDSTESDHTSSEAPPTKLVASSTDKSVELDDKSALGEVKGQINGVSGDVKDDCGKHGCDGSGVIAIAVVASICFVVIVLVVAVLLRKVITDNRRRRFKNVDYLINGMYT